MKSHQRALPAVTVLLLLTSIPLFALDSHLLDIRIKGIQQAGPPEYLGTQVLLSFQSDRSVRLVGARFAHEEYRIFHTYFRNEYDVFLLLLDVPKEVETLTYRLVVDGLWMSDPFNPRQMQDEFGRSFSLFSLANRPLPSPVSPRIGSEGTVTFLFHSLPGRAVSVAGDFNNWNPFWNRLVETRPGEYRLSLRLPAGRHYYYYRVNGERVLDPINPETARDYEGFRVSTFFLPPS